MHLSVHAILDHLHDSLRRANTLASEFDVSLSRNLWRNYDNYIGQDAKETNL